MNCKVMINLDNSLLQVNATIVAGLLILLTFQTVATESIQDLKNKAIFLKNEQNILLEQYSKVKNDIEITEGRQEIATKNDESGVLEFSVPPPPPILYAADKELEQLFRENYRESIKNAANIQTYNELERFDIVLANPIILVGVLLIPFLISMMLELGVRLSGRCEKNLKSSTYSTLIGIVLMITIFGIGVIIPFSN